MIKMIVIIVNDPLMPEQPHSHSLEETQAVILFGSSSQTLLSQLILYLSVSLSLSSLTAAGKKSLPMQAERIRKECSQKGRQQNNMGLFKHISFPKISDNY